MIVTPNQSIMQIAKLNIKQHPNWQPTIYENLELYQTKEQEDKNEYAKFRKWLIEKEKEFVIN